MMRVLAVACVLLASCTPAPAPVERAAQVLPQPQLPEIRRLAGKPHATPALSNAQLARDFLELSFALETGRALPVFTRFEGPVTVAIEKVDGANPPPTLSPDLDDLITRLRSEARIDIRRARTGEMPSITVSALPRAKLQRFVPGAACFVVPRVTGWRDYLAKRFSSDLDWTTLTTRTRASVFLPEDVSPQEMRDCLHEEVAQALGPVNDLYRLSESIFNDDNFHTVLTGYDMLILRTYYDDGLRNGMTRGEVAARLPAILNRLNPQGASSSVAFVAATNTAWKKAIETATSPRQSKARRRAAALRAVDLARAEGPADTRLAYSYYVLGRLTLSVDPDQALGAFLSAGRVYQNRPDTAVQEAHLALQIAAFQLSAGRADAAVRIVDRNVNVVKQSQHAALLSLLLMVKAEALEVMGRSVEAAATQKDALAWARYGFGDEREIRDRAAEILAISPRSRRGTST